MNDKPERYDEYLDFSLKSAKFPFLLRGPIPTPRSDKPLPEIFKTVPNDPRFQDVNQSLRCHRYYMDFLRCRFLLSEDHPDCQYLDKCAKRICPKLWLEKWDEQMEKGIHAGWIEPKSEHYRCDSCPKCETIK